jgi:2-polyprenyl-3-methyl-5-hydroxy-6-metoxy-1,4-benzoquinol methylase
MIDYKNCPICKNKNLLVIKKNFFIEFSKKSYYLNKCTECYHVFVKNPPNQNYITKYYKKKFWNDKKFIINEDIDWKKILNKTPGSVERYIRATRQYKFISKYIKDKKKRILDYGSGYSPLMFIFKKKKFNNLHIFEYDQSIIKYLRTKGIINYNKKKKNFDLICLSHVLEHVVDPIRFVESLKKNLHKKTLIYFDVPYQDYAEPFSENSHLHFFSKNSMLILFKKFKLIDHNIESHNFLDRFLLKIFFFFYKKLFFEKRKKITDPSNILKFAHKIWIFIKKISFSNINIFISRKDFYGIFILKR